MVCLTPDYGALPVWNEQGECFEAEGLALQWFKGSQGDCFTMQVAMWLDDLRFRRARSAVWIRPSVCAEMRSAISRDISYFETHLRRSLTAGLLSNTHLVVFVYSSVRMTYSSPKVSGKWVIQTNVLGVQPSGNGSYFRYLLALLQGPPSYNSASSAWSHPSLWHSELSHFNDYEMWPNWVWQYIVNTHVRILAKSASVGLASWAVVRVFQAETGWRLLLSIFRVMTCFCKKKPPLPIYRRSVIIWTCDAKSSQRRDAQCKQH